MPKCVVYVAEYKCNIRQFLNFTYLRIFVIFRENSKCIRISKAVFRKQNLWNNMQWSLFCVFGIIAFEINRAIAFKERQFVKKLRGFGFNMFLWHTQQKSAFTMALCLPNYRITRYSNVSELNSSFELSDFSVIVIVSVETGSRSRSRKSGNPGFF